MNKWMLCLCCIFPFGSWSEISSKNEPELVEKQIQELRKRLNDDQLEDLKEEVKGQELMIADWSAYSQEVQRIRKQEETEKEIQQQMKKLEEQKARLQQSQAGKIL